MYYFAIFALGKFAKFNKRYIMEENCIVINGHCYVLRECSETGGCCCHCAIEDICRQMIELPLCVMIHKVNQDSRLIYVEKIFVEKILLK